MDYPPGGENKLYSNGLIVALDSFSEIDSGDVTLVKDKVIPGKLEDEDTPKGIINQPRILLHNRNEIPSLLSTRKTPLTLSSSQGFSVSEMKIPMKVKSN